jgi:hypothetical protein
VRQHKNDRGIALLTVITALVALMIIAVPFGIAMRMGYERSVHNNARTRAQVQVDSALRFLEAYLVRTTDHVESENRTAEAKGDNSDPDCDTQAEIQPTLDRMSAALGVPPEEVRDPYGTTVGFAVEDENGKINLNNASYFAIGNLLGLSVLSGEVDENARSISLEDATAFPDRGYVKIGRELILYAAKEGNQLVGCERGLLADKPEHGKPELHKEGDAVVNYAAWAIAYYKAARRPGEYTPFETPDVSDISRLYELDPEVPVLTQADWERVAPYFTVYSRGPVAEAWTNPQPVTEGTKLPRESNEPDRFNFDNSYFYNFGTFVRLEERWMRTEEQTVDSSQQTVYPHRKDFELVYDAQRVSAQRGGESQMELFGRVHRQFDGTQLRVQTLVRAPVNLNTAPREVLVALFNHLQLRASPNDRVSAAEAGKVADAIIARRAGATPLRSLEEFRYLLRDLQTKQNAISANDATAIYRNAVNSHDQGLVFGTAPVTFRTFDVYTLHSNARIADGGGRLLAQLAATRVVEIGSQLTTDRTWDEQTDFEMALATTNSARYWTTGPNNTGQFVANNVEPWPRWQKPMQRYTFPFDPFSREKGRTDRTYQIGSDEDSQEATNGDIRLAPARMEHDTAMEDAVFVEHFDYADDVEGLKVESGFTLPRDGKVMSGAVENDLVQGFSIQFWFQPRAAAGNAVLFDWGESQFTNRIGCFVDSGTNELVFRVADNTLVNWASDIRYDLSDLNLAPNNWYHIHLIALGCHPSKMTLLVDGRAVGKTNLLAHLSGSLALDSGSLSVDDAAGFPPTGAVLVGNEVIGGVGSSGSSQTQDDACAKAGVAKVADQLK